MIRRILVPLDGSSRAEGILPHVVTLARTFGAGIDLLHVVESRTPGSDGGVSDPLTCRLTRADRLAYLDRSAEPLRRSGLDVHTLVQEGAPAETIVALLRRGPCDAVALTTHGSGNPALLRIGCTATAILLNAPGSVLLVSTSGADRWGSDRWGADHPGTHQSRVDPSGEDRGTGVRYRRVVAPVDCSPRSDGSLRIAARIARETGASLQAIHILDPLPTASRLPRSGEVGPLLDRILATNREEAERFLGGALARLGTGELVMEGQVIDAPRGPAEAVCALLERDSHDLVILNAHGRSGSGGQPLGGTAYKVVLSGRGTVLLLRDGEMPPVRRSEPARAALELRRPRDPYPLPGSIAARPH